MGISNLGTVASKFLGPIIYKEQLFGNSLGGVLLIGFLVCIVNQISTLCLINLDKKADREDNV